MVEFPKPNEHFPGPYDMVEFPKPKDHVQVHMISIVTGWLTTPVPSVSGKDVLTS